jgi:cellulose synthase/poly-beta-1,6-N-acetylglucosamine synthase-like glycosyltransferase
MTWIQWALAGAFFLCVGLVFYAYAIYPLLILVLSRWFGRHVMPPADSLSELPTISVLIAAYNEEAVIEDRILNALALDYPREKLQIVVASDGSSDATAAIVRRYLDRGVTLLDFQPRRGKAAVVNAAFTQLRGEIVILSDANTLTESDAARKLVRWFADPAVGIVCGRLVLTESFSGRNTDSIYWRYETFIKRSEGKLGALLGANGAIYAIRRQVFTPIPNDTFVDDLVLPLLARLRTGCRIVYDREAIAYEESAVHLTCEFHRRSRIGAGGFQSMTLLWKLIDPRRGWVAFTYLSHKILRWLGPFFLMGAMATNLLLWNVPFFRVALFAQVAFYAFAVFGAYVPPRIRLLKPLWLSTMFAGMNVALLFGFWRWISGSQKAAWKRTARLAEISPDSVSLSRKSLSSMQVNGAGSVDAPKSRLAEVGGTSR